MICKITGHSLIYWFMSSGTRNIWKSEGKKPYSNFLIQICYKCFFENLKQTKMEWGSYNLLGKLRYTFDFKPEPVKSFLGNQNLDHDLKSQSRHCNIYKKMLFGFVCFFSFHYIFQRVDINPNIKNNGPITKKNLKTEYHKWW